LHLFVLLIFGGDDEGFFGGPLSMTGIFRFHRGLNFLGDLTGELFEDLVFGGGSLFGDHI
jgi:hypothetical protein